MEATQTCCQMYIINIAFSLRHQESYVLGFGMLPFGLAGKQEFCLAKYLKSSLWFHSTLQQVKTISPSWWNKSSRENKVVA